MAYGAAASASYSCPRFAALSKYASCLLPNPLVIYNALVRRWCLPRPCTFLSGARQSLRAESRGSPITVFHAASSNPPTSLLPTQLCFQCSCDCGVLAQPSGRSLVHCSRCRPSTKGAVRTLGRQRSLLLRRPQSGMLRAVCDGFAEGLRRCASRTCWLRQP